MDKYLYVTSYWRCDDLENKENGRLYTETSLESIDFRYDNDTEEYIRSELLESIMDNNESSDPSRFVLRHCSKADADAEAEEISDDAPLGNLSIYLRIRCVDNGNESIAYANYNADFRNWISDEIWNMFATVVKTGYEQMGYTDVSVEGCSKDEYDQYSGDDVVYKFNYTEEN